MAKDDHALRDTAQPRLETALKLHLKAIEEEETPDRILELARELERLTRDK